MLCCVKLEVTSEQLGSDHFDPVKTVEKQDPEP